MFNIFFGRQGTTTVNAHKAFARMPFDSIPKVPRVSHDFWNYPSQKLAMKSSVLGPLNIHYQVRGKGEPLLLVHGLMTTSYSFRYLAPLLADRYTLFIPDLPGAGRSTMPQDPSYALPAMAQWLTEFQQALGISGCACVANSMGG